MANHDSKGNPDIYKYAKKFGDPDGPDPSEAAKARHRGSVRHAIRVAAGKPCVDLENPTMGPDDMLALFGYKRGDKLSPAQVIAARKITAAMAGNLRAMQQIEESIDGKPEQMQIQATMTYEELLAKGVKEYEESRE